MKTDLIEIFQTIRATLQPYATLGFSNRINSEEEYDLWAEKSILVNGEKRHELFFTRLKIHTDRVELTILPAEMPEHESALNIRELDEIYLNEIEGKLAAAYKIFKENEWV